jgi:hypothetical protein
MSTRDSMSRDECLRAISHFVQRESNTSSALQSLRISRLKLGTAIERLETQASRADISEQVRDQAYSVVFEIEMLLGIIHE